MGSKLNNLTLAVTHHAIIHSKSLANAASNLGTTSQTLERHLGKFIHQGAPLSYDILKAIPIANGAQTFGDNYSSPMRTKRVDLQALTLQKIHQQIAQSSSLSNAASSFGVDPVTLASHLGKFIHQEKPLSYHVLKTIPIQSGAQTFGEHYTSPMHAKKVDLQALTLQEIHQQIAQSSNLFNAASSLGVAYQTLASHLGKFFHQDAPLSYDLLKAIPIASGAQTFGECYTSPMHAKKVDLQALTLEEIHQQIAQSSSVMNAAMRLGVPPQSLTMHLGKFTHQEESLSYDILKAIPIANGAQTFGNNYSSPMHAKRVDLQALKLQEIHQQIAQSSNLSNAASRLGVTPLTLARHLGKFIHQGASLSYDVLKAIPIETGVQTFANSYTLPMRAKKVDLQALTLQEIHQQIAKSSSLANAATSIGVTLLTLASHLGKFIHQEEPLSYDVLKAIPIETGLQTFADSYTLPLRAEKVDLQALTLQEIHQQIVKSTSLTNAAISFGVQHQTLASHLGKFIHQDTPLSYDILKAIPTAKGAQTFGERYTSPMQAKKVDLQPLTLQEIHQQIVKSTNLANAAISFGVQHHTLARHLRKFIHQGAPLSYDVLKAIPIENGTQFFGDNYRLSLQALKALSAPPIATTLPFAMGQALSSKPIPEKNKSNSRQKRPHEDNPAEPLLSSDSDTSPSASHKNTHFNQNRFFAHGSSMPLTKGTLSKKTVDTSSMMRGK